VLKYYVFGICACPTQRAVEFNEKRNLVAQALVKRKSDLG